MVKIKGWKREDEFLPRINKYSISWINISEKNNLPKWLVYRISVFRGHHNLIEPFTDNKQWYIHSTLPKGNYFNKFKSKDKALLEAINYMRSHPNG